MIATLANDLWKTQIVSIWNDKFIKYLIKIKNKLSNKIHLRVLKIRCKYISGVSKLKSSCWSKISPNPKINEVIYYKIDQSRLIVLVSRIVNTRKCCLIWLCHHVKLLLIELRNVTSNRSRYIILNIKSWILFWKDWEWWLLIKICDIKIEISVKIQVRIKVLVIISRGIKTWVQTEWIFEPIISYI